jgi:hypothetical protein
MNTDSHGFYPTRSIALGMRPNMEASLPRLSPDQIEKLRELIVPNAIGGHQTLPADRRGSGYNDLVAVISIAWDALSSNQLLLVVTQGMADAETSSIDLAVVPYAAPARGSQHPLQVSEKYFSPDAAAEFLDELVEDIRAIDGLVPPKINLNYW